LQLQSISLRQFKTYASAKASFDKRIICIIGNNGVGKTNLLDAITLACLGKSYFQSTDRQCIRDESDFFRIECSFAANESSEKVVVKYKKSKGKSIEWSGKKLERISDLLGRVPLVVVAPDDIIEFLSGSEQRRRFLDFTISQNDRHYLEGIIHYNRLLKQRNAYLKKFDNPKAASDDLLMTISEQMAPIAQSIYLTRSTFLETFKEELEKVYQKIAGKDEVISSSYISSLKDDDLYDSHLANLEKDKILQRTVAGVHKDDFKVKINGRAVKAFASQGQKKSFMLALKSAQYHWLSRQTGKRPIILLDDFFEKLDALRLKAMLDLVLDLNFGQVFITDTQKGRILNLLKKVTDDYELFSVESGTLKKL